MSVLRNRIARQPQAMMLHAADHFDEVAAPAAAGAASMGSAAPPPAQVMTMPLTIVTVTADGVTVAEAQPLYTGPLGRPVPATGRGRWNQLMAVTPAGRP